MSEVEKEKTEKKKNKRVRRRRAAIRLEEHPGVKNWCAQFTQHQEREFGYTPTQEQCLMAFVNAALKAMGAKK